MNHQHLWKRLKKIKSHNSSQGKGIWLLNRLDEILKKQKQCIVASSEYISNLLLVNGLKFDMRIYVGITCWNSLRLYIYQDGLAHFATNQYSSDLSSKENLFVHLTNYSLNKYSEKFIANDDADDSAKGHKWSLIALMQFFNKNGLDVPMIWNRIEDMIIKSLISIQNTVYHAMQMSVPYRDNCFEVLGFDILLDIFQDLGFYKSIYHHLQIRIVHLTQKQKVQCQPIYSQ